MTSGTTRLLQRITSGEVTAANALGEIEQAGGAALVLIELFRAIANTENEGGSLIDPNVGYVRTNGSDTTGTGEPSAPVLTIQKAFDLGFRRFNLGVGSVGALDVGGVAVTLWIQSTAAYMGTLTNRGNTLTLYVSGNFQIFGIDTSGINDAMPGGDIIVTGNAGLVINSDVITRGAGSESEDMEDGGAGGNVTMIGPFEVTSSFDSTGGSGANGGSDGAPGEYHFERGVSVPAPIPSNAATTVAFANIDGVACVDSYP